nr:UDP-N-acetylglucosamine 2-epimerase [uncultured Niameybacter sp.]
MKKICVVTGTRAEYGLLKPLMHKIEEDEQLELQLLVTGMHLSPEFGMTYKEIEADGFLITEKVEMLLSADTPTGICKSMGLGMMDYSGAYSRLKPDMIVVLGDRFEAFSAVASGLVHNIPVSHIHGGELTQGAIDDALRHAMTKMSYLHFTSDEVYRQRVIQLGEEPSRVYNVGALGVENIRSLKLLSKKELEESIEFNMDGNVVLVTFHPVTREVASAKNQCEELLNALDEVKDLKLIFTKANADTEGRIINEMIDQYVQKDSSSRIAFTSMGQLRYLSAMKYSKMVIGNSSSGILEAPALGIPTINIGDRQKGRIKARSVFDCKAYKEDIRAAITKILEAEEVYRSIYNKNQDTEAASSQIIRYMKQHLNTIDMKKSFYDIQI